LDEMGDGILGSTDIRAAKTSSGGCAVVLSEESPHGYYESATIRSLGETLVSESGGAIGAMVNSGVLSGAEARQMTESVVRHALGSEEPAARGLGRLCDEGRLSLVGRSGFDNALRTCLLLGDPATVVKTPPSAKVSSGAGQAAVVDRSSERSPATELDKSDGKYAPIWQMLSPGAGRTASQGAASKGPALVLKATMVDGGTPFAIVETSEGRQRLVKAGDHVGGAQIVAINPGSIVLQTPTSRLDIKLRGR
jgi:hypothetical protein